MQREPGQGENLREAEVVDIQRKRVNICTATEMMGVASCPFGFSMERWAEQVLHD